MTSNAFNHKAGNNDMDNKVRIYDASKAPGTDSNYVLECNKYMRPVYKMNSVDDVISVCVRLTKKTEDSDIVDCSVCFEKIDGSKNKCLNCKAATCTLCVGRHMYEQQRPMMEALLGVGMSLSDVMRIIKNANPQCPVCRQNYC